jgi:flagellar basal body P-ring protein FlgI
MKTPDEMQAEYDFAQRMALEKTIELTLYNQGIDPERVSMKDFDRIRRISNEIDKINEKTNEQVAKIRNEAQIEVNNLLAELEGISVELKEKQAKPAEPEKPSIDGNS